MFAHGEHDMRTKEMNLRDGLITEEAVKIFQRVRRTAQRNKLPASLAKQQRAAVASQQPAAPVAPRVRRNDPYAFQALCPCDECRAIIEEPLVCTCEECSAYPAYAYTPSEGAESECDSHYDYSYESVSECDCAECRAAAKYAALPPPPYSEAVMLVP